MKIKSLFKNRAIQNASWIMSAHIGQMLVSVVVGAFSARYLGPDNYGTLNYTASFVAFFSAIASLGMDGVVVNKLVSNPNKEGLYLGSSMAFRLISSVLSIFAISLVVYILNPNEILVLLLAIIQSVQLLFSAVQILSTWFHRHLKSKYVSIGTMLASVSVSAFKIILLITAKSIVWFAVANILSSCIVMLVEVFFYKKSNGQVLQFSWKVGREILGESYHFVLSGIMVALYGQMDKIMIREMMTSQDVGFYTAAAVICGMWLFVPTALISSFEPAIMDAKNEGNEPVYQKRLLQLFSTVIWLCVIVSLGISLLAKPAILLLYGKAYLPSVNTLRILIWCETFAMIGTARGTWILCEKKNRYVKYYLSIGAAANLILNAVLIPSWGINGAAVATLSTQIITSIIAPLFFKETRSFTGLVLNAFLFKWFWERKKKLI